LNLFWAASQRPATSSLRCSKGWWRAGELIACGVAGRTRRLQEESAATGTVL
jgi:hypothetical protein